MHADITALESLAAAHSRHAADLRAISTTLSDGAPQPEAFGPAGARFIAALHDAVSRDVHAAVALSNRIADASAAAAATAGAFGDADRRAGTGVGAVGI